MNDKVSTAREALIAELLGDVNKTIDKLAALSADLESVDNSARETAQALVTATSQYRAQVDDSVARLRVEMSAVIVKATEHAAQALMGQQTKVLQESARLAFSQVLGKELLRKTQADWFKLAGISALIGALVAVAMLVSLRRLGFL